LEGGRECGREHAPGYGDQTKPLTGGEYQHVKCDAVECPQHHDRKMPPASKPDRMTNTGDAQPTWHGHRIVFRGPNPALRNRILETEPLRAGRAVAGPIKARVISQDLDSGADDEHHEEHVQEVLQLQPPGKSGIDRGGGLRDAWILLDEGLHALKLSQALREGNHENERHGSDR
jgi:hypothetical protein